MVAFNPRVKRKLVEEALKAFPNEDAETVSREYDEMFSLQYRQGAHAHLQDRKYELTEAEKERLKFLEAKFAPKP